VHVVPCGAAALVVVVGTAELVVVVGTAELVVVVGGHVGTVGYAGYPEVEHTVL